MSIAQDHAYQSFQLTEDDINPEHGDERKPLDAYELKKNQNMVKN